MPTYRCTTPPGQLAATQKARVAEAIARVHSTVTGAPVAIVQVLFTEVPPEACYVGGRPVGGDHLFVEATIRGGRAAPEVQRLMEELLEALTAAADIPRRAVWIYFHELPARRMAEFGRVLPEPGDEEAWLRDLADDAPEHRGAH